MKTTNVPPTYLKQIPGQNSDKAKAITLCSNNSTTILAKMVERGAQLPFSHVVVCYCV